MYTLRDKSKKLNEALSNIDDKYLDTTERMKAPKKKSPWIKWGAAAAAVLLIAGAVTLAHWNREHPLPPYPDGYQGAGPVDVLPQGGTAQPDGPYARFVAYEAEYPEQVQYDPDNYAPWWEQRAERAERYQSDPAALDDFLTAMLPALLADTEGENRVCSPLNLYMALAEAAELSDGMSSVQLRDLLGAYSMGTLRARADVLWNANYRDDGTATSILASSLWMRDDFDYNDETLRKLRDNYHASSYYGDMSDPQYTEALRDWLNRQTGGQLSDAVENVALDANTVLELLTTVYFRAKWAERFDPANTAPAVFHAPDGDVECDFMNEAFADFWAYRGKRFIAAQYSFVTSGSMWFLLPDEGVTPEELLSDEEALAFLISGGTEQSEWYFGKLALPKLDVTSDLDLSDALKRLGVTDVFDPSAADFSPLFGGTEGIALSTIRHTARLVMDEEGVTATAFTEMGMGAGGPQEEMDFILDRPFLFKIAASGDTPLFVGIVNQP